MMGGLFGVAVGVSEIFLVVLLVGRMRGVVLLVNAGGE